MTRVLNRLPGLCLLAVAFFAVHASAAEPRRPNILYVIVDDQSPFDLRKMTRLKDPYRLWNQPPLAN